MTPPPIPGVIRGVWCKYFIHASFSSADHLNSLLSFGTDELGEATVREIREECVATSGYDQLSVYSSVAHGDETPEQLWGHNVPRLVELKKKWDPSNAFAFMHPLPTN